MRAGVVTGLLFGAAIVHAQPAPGEIDRAKELYQTARTALDEGRHDDAIRDFGASYDITKDPVMFYWIANANEKAGKCDLALVYYGRYLKEGKPTEPFLETVRQRITACGGDPQTLAQEPAEPPPVEPPANVGEPTPPAGAVAPAPLRARHQGPWLMVGGSIALLTVGAVLAYSAEAAENDIEDLYVGLEGNPPVFDARTKKRYDDLISEGERYERLSWISFALAGGLAAGAAVWFYLSRDDSSETVITPTVGKDGAGVTTTIRW